MKKKHRLLYKPAVFMLMWTLFSAFSNQLFSQTVSGTVKNSDGQPVTGVTIGVKGSSRSALSGPDGRFSITAASDATLTFSSIGFTAQEVPVAGQSSVDVTLATDIRNLDVVVVTALGIKKDVRKLGYATSIVNTDDITDVRSTNFANTLQGKIPGLNVSPPAGGPGGSTKIRIRGQSSFGGNNSPLIVVNGIPINNTSTSATKSSESSTGNPTGGSSDQGDGLQSINPDDIESMTVLKGAPAAALYGFRAKDGVVIITTKSGKGQSGIGVEVTSNYQAQQALDYTDFQYEFGQGEFGKRQTTVAEAQSSGVFSFGTRFDGVPVPQFDGSTQPYVPYKNHIRDFYRTGSSFTNSVALSGGNDKGNFRLAFANTDANAIMPNSDYHKKILNLGLTYNFTDKFSAQVNANYSNEYNKNPPQIGLQDMSANTTIYTMANSINIAWLKNTYMDVNGNEQPLARFTNRNNPYWVAYKRFENVRRDRIFGNVSLRYQLLDWLYVQGRIGQDYFTRPYNYNIPTGTRSAAAAPTGFNGRFYQDVSTFRERNMDFLVGASKKVGDFGADLTLGGNRLQQISDNINTLVTNFFVRDLYTIGNGQTKSPNYSYGKKQVNSLYGALELSYRDYLYLNLTARKDYFSTLNVNSNSYTYPSASLSFVFTQAFKSLPSWLTFGKLRAGYAEVGSDTDPYQTLLYYSLNPNTFNNVALGSIATSVSPNPNLKPLSIKESELGLELRMFNNRVNIDFSVYDKKTFDDILRVDVSNSSGYSQTLVNVGKLQNRGLEFLLSVFPVRNTKFSWETSFNGSYNESKVLALANGQTRIDVGSGEFFGTLSHEIGKPMASLRGFDYRRDAKGDIVTTGGLFAQGNVVTFGNAIPKFIGGWSNAVRWNKLRLATQIDFKTGYKIMSNSNLNFIREGLTKSSLVGREGGVVFDAVNVDGSPNITAVEAQQFYTQYRGTNIAAPFIYKGDFVRWRSVSLGYDLTSLMKGKNFIKGLNVNLFCYNVLMIKKYIDNLDPEAQVSASDNFQGIETHTLPTTRSFGANVSVKF